MSLFEKNSNFPVEAKVLAQNKKLVLNFYLIQLISLIEIPCIPNM